jgi:thiol:disulfide interchange protein DsbD
MWMACSRYVMVFCLYLVGILASVASAQNAGFLPPDQAFGFSAKMQGSESVRVTFTIAPNYYMYRDEFAFRVVSPDGSVVQNGVVKLPKAEMKFDENFNKEMAIYHNSVSVDVPVRKVKDAEALFKLVVTSRGCADKGLCYPPRQTQAVLTAVGAAKSSASTEATTQKTTNQSEQPSTDKAQSLNASSSIPEAPSAVTEQSASVSNSTASSERSAATPTLESARANSAQWDRAAGVDNTAYARTIFEGRNVFYALALVFGLGVLLSLTPCMLPMLPILSTILAGQKNVSRMSGFWLAVAYVTGMAVVYALVGVLVAQTGATLHQYLQSPWVLGGFSLVLILLALSMFDVFALHLPERWVGRVQRMTGSGRRGYVGAVIFGAASALIASPCVTAPLIGLMAFIAQTGNVWLGGVALLVLAYGMGLPLLLLGAGFGRVLPKSGLWMVRVKQLIGVLMLLAALWIAQPLWGKYWERAWGEPAAELVFAPASDAADLQKIIETSDKPIVLDLYADWCRSCIEMEQKTFSDARVREQFADMTLVRVDMTAFNDEHATLLQRFGLYGPPAVLVLEPLTGKERLRVVGFESPDGFLKRLEMVR